MKQAIVFAIASILLLGCGTRSPDTPIHSDLHVHIPNAALSALYRVAATADAKIIGIKFDVYFHPADQAVAIVQYEPISTEKTVTLRERIFTNSAWPSRLGGGATVQQYRTDLSQPTTKWTAKSDGYEHEVRHIFYVGGRVAQVRLGKDITRAIAYRILRAIPEVTGNTRCGPRYRASDVKSIESQGQPTQYVIGVGDRFIVVRANGLRYDFLGFQLRTS